MLQPQKPYEFIGFFTIMLNNHMAVSRLFPFEQISFGPSGLEIKQQEQLKIIKKWLPEFGKRPIGTLSLN